MITFERNIHTYTMKEQLRLHKAKAIILGVGGGGSCIAEIFARTGIGNITLVDSDIYEDSNKNRQIGALNNTIGQYKVDVMGNRIMSINTDCNICAIRNSINDNNYIELLQDKDIIMDTVDGKDNKLKVSKYVKSLNKVYTTGGLGGYNFWCATLKDCSIEEFIFPNTDEQIIYPCASGVFAQAALQAQQAINYYLNREQCAIDKIIKVNQQMLCISVEDIGL